MTNADKKLVWYKALDVKELPDGRVKPVTCGLTTLCMTHHKGEFAALDNLTWSNVLQRLDTLYPDFPELWQILVPLALVTPGLTWYQRRSTVWRLATSLLIAVSALLLLTTEGRYLYFVPLAALALLAVWTVEAAQAPEVAEMERSLQAGKISGLLFVAGEAIEVELPVQQSGSFASDPGEALRIATAVIPGDYVPQVVLLTDGNENRGELARAAYGVNLPVHVLPLPAFPQPEACIAELRAPDNAAQGLDVAVEVVVVDDGSTDSTAERARNAGARVVSNDDDASREGNPPGPARASLSN